MHASQREKTLTEYISARVTQQEGDRIQECAEAAGLTMSESCRQVVLSVIDTPAQTRLLLSEFIALRTVAAREAKRAATKSAEVRPKKAAAKKKARKASEPTH